MAGAVVQPLTHFGIGRRAGGGRLVAGAQQAVVAVRHLPAQAAQLLNQFMPEITVRAEYGFWLTLAAIAAAAILLAVVAARTRERAAPA